MPRLTSPPLTVIAPMALPTLPATPGTITSPRRPAMDQIAESSLRRLTPVVNSPQTTNLPSLSAAIDAIPLAIVIMRVDGVIAHVNAEALNLFGYERDELQGRPIEILVPERFRAAHPKHRNEYLLAPTARRMGAGRELQGVRKDGSEFPLEIGLNPIRTEHEMYILSAIVDITERRRLEALTAESAARYTHKMKMLSEAAFAVASADSFETVMRVITDQARRIVGAHQAVTSYAIDQDWTQQITGLSLSDKYERYRDFDATPDGAGIYAWVCEHGRTVRMTQQELEAHPRWTGFRDKNGTDHSAQHPPMRGWLATPLKGAGNQSVGVLQLSDKFIGEFTEDDEATLEQFAQLAAHALQMHGARKDLENRAKELESANRELDEFAFVASHDLQEPLRKIASCCQALQEDYGTKLDDEGREWLTFAVDSSKRIQTMVKDLLALSRFARQPTTLEQVNAADACLAAIENLQLAIEESGAKVAYGGLPTLWTNRNQLSQVFQNLIGNAIKYRSERPPEIQISAERTGEFWKFRVQDNGIGIAPEFHDRIFVIFQRLHNKEDFGGGTGIGLAIVKKIIDRLGGKVWIESQVGVGSSFFFTLPAERPGLHEDE